MVREIKNRLEAEVIDLTELNRLHAETRNGRNTTAQAISAWQKFAAMAHNAWPDISKQLREQAAVIRATYSVIGLEAELGVATEDRIPLDSAVSEHVAQRDEQIAQQAAELATLREFACRVRESLAWSVPSLAAYCVEAVVWLDAHPGNNHRPTSGPDGKEE